MIDEHRVLTLNKIGGGQLELEVNWRPDDKESNGCKIIRVKDGDRSFTIKRDDLTTLLLVMGDAKTQEALLPMQVRRVRKIERLLHGSFKASKNYTAGDTIHYSFPWIDEIPLDDEVLSGNLDKLKQSAKSLKTKTFP